ncbi:hypothetical protein TN53_42010, partial [Streptomyces sp. WM6386]
SYAPAGGVHTQLDQVVPAAADEPAQVEVVEPGDSLSTIAAQELDDGNRWPELFAATKGKPQPDGLPAIPDPDVIYPGQHVTVPGTRTGTSDEDEQDSEQTAPPDPSTSDDEHQPGHDDDQEAQPPAPSHSASPTPEPSASSSPPAARPGPHHEQGAPPPACSMVPRPSGSGVPSTASP